MKKIYFLVVIDQSGIDEDEYRQVSNIRRTLVGN